METDVFVLKFKEKKKKKKNEKAQVMSQVLEPNRKPRALNNVSIISDDSPLSGWSDGAETGLSEINNGDGQRVRQRLLSPVDVSLSGRVRLPPHPQQLAH